MASATKAPSGVTTTETVPPSNEQTTEVASLKIAFPNGCRVVCDVGEYSNIVTVQPESMDATIKFQLSPAYPTVIPDIAIRSASLKEENLMDVQQSLRSKAHHLIGQPMIQALIGQAVDEFRALGLKPGKVIKANGDTFLDGGKKKPKNRKPKKKPKSEDEVIEQKLPSMKTADDVVKRIIWDGALEKDHFIVGYFDRFRGLVEKYFSAFSWEDLASVDYDVLAVPKHRIQYFKYKDVKVWDKPRRIDNVFGSADGTKTIDVVIKEVEERERLQQAGAVGDSAATKDNHDDDDDKDENDDDEDDSSDDDGITVTIGSSGHIGTSTGQERNSHVADAATASKKDGEGDEELSLQAGFDPYWRDKLRPNYFLCVRVTSTEIADQIVKVQDHLMDQEPLFSECCIPGASLHITLNTLGLDTPEQLSQCMDALKRIKPELEAALPNSVLHLRGVSNFYNRVVYAQVHHKKDFLEFCNLLKLLLREAGVQIRDGYDFVPHMTIMKVTRPVARQRGTKNIEPQLYSRFSDMNFGEQKVDSICLCSMERDRREDGFYLTPLELNFR